MPREKGEIAWSTAASVVPIADREVHLWRIRLDAAADRLDDCARLLSADENEKARRFKFDVHRSRYVVTRATLRTLLSKYLRKPPSDVSILEGRHGKPEIGSEGEDLEFNLSHSGGLAVFAFGRGRRVGVDIEETGRDVEFRDLAQRFFSEQERAVLRGVPDPDVREAFYECWTRKEAYIKALGLGVTHGLDNFAVAFGPAAEPGILHSDLDPDAARRWSMRSFLPAEGFVGALVAEGRPSVVRGFDFDDGRAA